ncbi:Lateral signaling target protein 2-like [Hondaea fermentalgiana]|uniref:Lateral signaling target protein 2-like n=1 Tax=Hondaea fermentalgiana TaxID=2315210 RepID=A0A2R5GAZ3_9STRA|nr:Lateral signaling target protein 2-like [Hondaea fermentalgiana]|eukprot:GBG28186.1 Lateral signaling target protein 2-like [Hondaea fermentalgiana]
MDAENSPLRGNALVRAEKEAVRKAAGMVTAQLANKASSLRADRVPVAQTLASPRSPGGEEARGGSGASTPGPRASSEAAGGSSEGVEQARAKVALLKLDVHRLLEDLENLVWWTCTNDTQKKTWQGLLVEVRAAVDKLEAQADGAMNSTRATLEIARAELAALREAERKRCSVAPWRPDAEAQECACCSAPFSFLLRRRHHCRCCGEVVCAGCSPNVAPVPQWGYQGPVRVCEKCFGTTNSPEGTPASSPRTAVPVSSVAVASRPSYVDTLMGSRPSSSSFSSPTGASSAISP